MKKNYLFLIAASVAFAFTACSPNELNLPEEIESGVVGEMKHVSLKATTENDNSTKVTLVGTTYGWSEGVDKMMVTTTNGLAESQAYSAGKFDLEYTGSRNGYAVIPSSFLTAYDGTNLTITYPSSYDISSYITDSYLAGGKYDASGAYLPIPMIATSTEGDDNLKFYALGALVRVTVSDVPVGTKKLYITFNQTVTGNFTVATPFTPGTSSVAVADASTSSTVEFTISADGITSAQAANSFVLYIPVPTTSDLGIASSSKTKSQVYRNMGYAWSVPAITRATSTTDFKIGDKNYIIAPGNLLASFDADGNLSSWSFLDGNGGLDQLKTVISSITNNPHVYSYSDDPLVKGEEPTWGVENTVRDAFNFNRIYKEFTGDSEDPASGVSIPTDATITIEEKEWRMATNEELKDLFAAYGYTSQRDGIKARVKGVESVMSTRVIVQVNGTPYENYGITKYTYGGKKCIAGVLLFPDGYVDQTDILPYVARARYWKNHKPGISYAAFTKMIAAGALFLPAAGFYKYNSEGGPNPLYPGWKNVDDDDETSDETAGYGVYMSATASNNLICNFRWEGNIYTSVTFNRNHYYTVRLIRSVDIE